MKTKHIVSQGKLTNAAAVFGLFFLGCEGGHHLRYPAPYGFRRIEQEDAPIEKSTPAETQTNGVLSPVNSANFKRFVLDRKGYSIVDVWQNFCHPCEELKPVLVELARKNPKIGFFTFANNWEDSSAAIDQYEIHVAPIMLVFKDGVLIEKMEGLGVDGENIKKLRELVRKFTEE